MVDLSAPVVFEFVWALYMTAGTAFIAYSVYRVLRHFRQDAELSMTRIFLNDRIPQGFKRYATALLVYTGMIYVGVIATLLGFDSVIYHYLSKGGGAVAITGWGYLAHQLAESSVPTPTDTADDEPTDG